MGDVGSAYGSSAHLKRPEMGDFVGSRLIWLKSVDFRIFRPVRVKPAVINAILEATAKRGDSFLGFGWAECSVWMAVVVNEAGEVVGRLVWVKDVVVVGFTWMLESQKARGGRGTAMQMLLWPAAPHTCLSCSLPSSIPLSTPFSTPSEYPIPWPSCNT